MPAHTTISPATHEVSYKSIFAAGSNLDQVLNDLYTQYQRVTGVNTGKPGTDEICILLRFELIVTYNDATDSYGATGSWYLLREGSW